MLTIALAEVSTSSNSHEFLNLGVQWGTPAYHQPNSASKPSIDLKSDKIKHEKTTSKKKENFQANRND